MCIRAQALGGIRPIAPPDKYRREREQLSFVPARRRVFEPHDAQTVALIRQLAELERLPHGERVSKLLEHRKWLEVMTTPEEKQRGLEPLIASVRREPTENEHLVIFLMLVFEPVRRSVSKTGALPAELLRRAGHRTAALAGQEAGFAVLFISAPAG